MIQNAVDVAASGDEVLVTNGVYQTGGRKANGGVTNRVAVTKPISLRSVNGPAVTTIRGDQLPEVTYSSSSIRGVYLTNAASLTGFTITAGSTAANSDSYYVDSSGGGIWCEDNSVTISNCVVTGNTAWTFGGGAVRGSFYGSSSPTTPRSRVIGATAVGPMKV